MLRNYVFCYARAAGLHPEMEKPGLLQPRPYVGGVTEDGSRPSNPEARRPADVYIPRWRRGMPMALDFACTSGLRDIQACIRDPTSPVTSYEGFKRSHLDTERLCREDGLDFCPMVVEAAGGAWGPAAVGIFTELAKTKALLTGEPVEALLTELYQGLSVILRRENARALVKRMRPAVCVADDVLAAAAALQLPPDTSDLFFMPVHVFFP